MQPRTRFSRWAKWALFLLFWVGTPAFADPVRDARWREDLSFLATQLVARHPNPFFQTTQEAFNQAVTQLGTDIPNLSDAAVIARLAAVSAMLGDGHTALWLTQSAAAYRVLPLQFQWFEDGIFIVGAAREYSRALGARVLRVGSKDIQEVVASLRTVISSDNEAGFRNVAPRYLALADLLASLQIVPDAGMVTFECQDASGAVATLEVASRASAGTLVRFPDAGKGFIPLYRQRTQEYYWFVYLESSRTLYFRYNLCRESASLPFSAFVGDLFAAFDTKTVDRLVVDFRQNPGGNSAVLDPFFNGLGSRLDRLGNPTRLYALIDNGTFSSAMLNVSVIMQGAASQGASFVRVLGEATGGKPAAYGEVKTFQLPNSGLTVQHSTKFFDSPFKTDSLLPDLTVRLYSRDYFARHDPVLAAVLAEEF